MKSIYALTAAIFVAATFAATCLQGLQWNAAFALAPLVAGMLAWNLREQMAYADRPWEELVSFLAALIFGLVGIALGVYACAAYAEIGYLTSEVLVIGGLVSFGLMAIGAIFSWITLPAEAVEESEGATSPA
jgi:hypothetical protein